MPSPGTLSAPVLNQKSFQALALLVPCVQGAGVANLPAGRLFMDLGYFQAASAFIAFTSGFCRLRNATGNVDHEAYGVWPDLHSMRGPVVWCVATWVF